MNRIASIPHLNRFLWPNRFFGQRFFFLFVSRIFGFGVKPKHCKIVHFIQIISKKEEILHLWPNGSNNASRLFMPAVFKCIMAKWMSTTKVGMKFEQFTRTVSKLFQLLWFINVWTGNKKCINCVIKTVKNTIYSLTVQCESPTRTNY